ncbi:MAG: SGNH/GDSL hydrolase family protein, partial [Paracoccaceae bacterium]
PSEVATGTGAARYMVSTYLLYLKISGLFHLIIGLLRMYGFGLAETHHFYLFASSFTDFWRRINIYWKDFIQKLVFNPIYFATKRLGATGSLVVATLVAFTATWLFHSYQWFWIRGTFPIVWSDLVFWFGLGIVVMINVLIETRLGRRRSLGKGVRTLRQEVIHGLKIAGTFTAICILWTIWSTPEVEDLGFIWQAVLNSGPIDIAVLVGIPLGIGALGVLFGGRQREVSRAGAGSVRVEGGFWREATMVTVGAAALILIALQPGLLTPISPQLSNLVSDVRARAPLNAADVELLRRGYYEDLGDITRFNIELWEVMGDTPPGWMGKFNQLRNRTDGIRNEFIPSTTSVSKGATRTINSHGMRDREYPLVPGQDTFRIALLGSSHDMGDGVEDDETYENVVEDRLNADLGPVTGLTYEILNFSLSAYTPIQKLETLRLKVLDFEPDLIIYAAASNELEWVFRPVQLRWLAQNNLFDQFPDVLEAMNRADVGTKVEEFDSNNEVTTAKLKPYEEDVFAKLLKKFRDLGVRQEAKTALLLLEIPDDTSQSLAGLERLKTVGEEVGVPILDLRGAFVAVSDRSTLWIAPFDAHTNAAGHQMIADLLFEKLLQNDFVPTKAPGAD